MNKKEILEKFENLLKDTEHIYATGSASDKYAAEIKLQILSSYLYHIRVTPPSQIPKILKELYRASELLSASDSANVEQVHEGLMEFINPFIDIPVVIKRRDYSKPLEVTSKLLGLYGLRLEQTESTTLYDIKNLENRRLGSVRLKFINVFTKGFKAAHENKSLFDSPYDQYGSDSEKSKFDEWFRGYELIRQQDVKNPSTGAWELGKQHRFPIK
jgi:hypothetical protein